MVKKKYELFLSLNILGNSSESLKYWNVDILVNTMDKQTKIGFLHDF